MPNFLDGAQNLAALTVPGVYGDIILPTPNLIGSPTNIMGLVGVGSWGPLNALIPVSKPLDCFLQLGAPRVRNKDIASYVSAASQVGGSVGFLCVRVSDGTDVAANATVQGGPTSAVGNVTFTTNPANTNTLTLGGTVVTFVTAAPVGLQVQIGANTGATLQALLTFLQASADVNLVKFFYSVTGLVLGLTAAVAGTAGNALTVTTNVSGATTSGGTLSGGTNAGTTGLTLTAKYTGILGNSLVFSIQNGSLANSYMAIIAFPGLPPEQINNIPGGLVQAAGSITFTINPTNGQTLTFNGTTFTFVTSGATGNQLNIGTSLQATLNALVIALNTSLDANISACTFTLANFVLSLTYKAAGTNGNQFAISTNVTGATTSGATLTGGIGAGNAFWLSLAAAINNGNQYHGPSTYVTATAGASTSAPTVSLPVALAGGTDGDTGVTDATMFGQDIVPRKGMFVFRNSSIDAFTLCDMATPAYYAAEASFAIAEGFLAVQSTPSGDAIFNALATRINGGIDSPWFWLIMGDWPTFFDEFNQQPRLVAPAAFGVGILGNLAPSQSPLNKPLQGVVATQRSTLGQSYSDTELSLINTGGIDTILAPPESPGGYYFSFATGRNTSSNTAANGIEYTRMTNFLMRTAQSKAAGSFVGRLQSIQPNDQTRAQAKSLFDGLSAQLASPEVGTGINGQGMIDIPWQVVCDLSNNPPNLQALGYMFLYWKVRYLNVVRYFVIKFQGGGNVVVSSQNTPPAASQFQTGISGVGLANTLVG